jgi:hypothetical protein
MFIRWQRRRSSAPASWRREAVHLSAILAQSVRVEGKPVQRHIAYLAGIGDEIEQLGDIILRCRFWEQVTRKLDGLGKRVSPEDRRRIETAIAKRVSCPTEDQYKQWHRQRVALLGPNWVRPALTHWPHT